MQPQRQLGTLREETGLMARWGAGLADWSERWFPEDRKSVV